MSNNEAFELARDELMSLLNQEVKYNKALYDIYKIIEEDITASEYDDFEYKEDNLKSLIRDWKAVEKQIEIGSPTGAYQEAYRIYRKYMD